VGKNSTERLQVTEQSLAPHPAQYRSFQRRREKLQKKFSAWVCLFHIPTMIAIKWYQLGYNSMFVCWWYQTWLVANCDIGNGLQT